MDYLPYIRFPQHLVFIYTSQQYLLLSIFFLKNWWKKDARQLMQTQYMESLLFMWALELVFNTSYSNLVSGILSSKPQLCKAIYFPRYLYFVLNIYFYSWSYSVILRRILAHTYTGISRCQNVIESRNWADSWQLKLQRDHFFEKCILLWLVIQELCLCSEHCI